METKEELEQHEKYASFFPGRGYRKNESEIQESRLIKLEKEKVFLKRKVGIFSEDPKAEIEKQKEEMHTGDDFRKLGRRGMI